MAIRQPKPRPPIPIDHDDWSAFDGVEMSEAEYLALDDAHETNLEYIDGATWVKAVVEADHRSIAGEFIYFFAMLRRAIGGASGPEGRVRLPGGRYAMPDAAYWLPGIPSGNDSLPTIAVEVRSRTQSMASQRRKCRMYRDAGIPIVWLIDPISRTAEVFEGDLDAEPVPHGGVLRSDLVPGLEIPVDDLWKLLD